jgi:hypothetical protein
MSMTIGGKHDSMWFEERIEFRRVGSKEEMRTGEKEGRKTVGSEKEKRRGPNEQTMSGTKGEKSHPEGPPVRSPCACLSVSLDTIDPFPSTSVSFASKHHHPHRLHNPILVLVLVILFLPSP